MRSLNPFRIFCRYPDECVFYAICTIIVIVFASSGIAYAFPSDKEQSMISFGDTMDPHSLEIKREGKAVGAIHWHRFREDSSKIELVPYELPGQYNRFTQAELEQILERMRNIRSNGGNKYGPSKKE